MKSLINLGLLVLSALIITSCAQTVDLTHCTDTEPYGFWSGLLHGIIAPFSFIASLFKEEVAFYAVHNTGGWYDFGFLLGIGFLAKSCTKPKFSNRMTFIISRRRKT